jgi:hypothetical protein
MGCVYASHPWPNLTSDGSATAPFAPCFPLSPPLLSAHCAQPRYFCYFLWSSHEMRSVFNVQPNLMPGGAAARARAGVVPANYELQCKSRISFGAIPCHRSRRVCPVRHSTNRAQTKRRGDVASGCSHARCGAVRALYVLRRALRALLGGCGERCASPRRAALSPEPEEAASWSEVSAFARPRDGPQDAHGPASASTQLLVVYVVRRAIVGLPARTEGCALLRKVRSERPAQPHTHSLSASRSRVARAVLEVEAYWSARTVSAARAAAREGAGGRLGRLTARARRARPQLANGQQALAGHDTVGSLALPLYSQPPFSPHRSIECSLAAGAGNVRHPLGSLCCRRAVTSGEAGDCKAALPYSNQRDARLTARLPAAPPLRPKLQRGMLSRDSVAATTLLKHAGQERMPPLLTASLFFLLHTRPQGWLSY